MDDLDQDDLDQLNSIIHGRWQIVLESDTRGGMLSWDRMERLRVPGGWIYRNTVDLDHNGNDKVNLVFVPEAAPERVR